jgi:hypothetical protein
LPPNPRCAILKSVEHICSQCHSAVADSAPFCTNCGSPQIRFTRHEVSTIPILVAEGVSPPVAAIEAPYSPGQPTSGMNRRAAFRSAMNAGIVAALLSLVSKGSFAFALPFAGFLCVLLYRRYGSATDPSPGLGFRLGVWTGVAGFAILIILSAISTLGFNGQNELRDALIQVVHQAQSRYTDPQSRAALEQFLTPGGLATLMVFGSAFTCVFFAVLSGIGGAVSAALLRRKLPPH